MLRLNGSIIACIVLVLSLAAAEEARASLVWETRELAFEAAVEDHQAVGEFTFTNRGESPVTIRSIRSSCGCTTTDLQGRVYQPGESGTLTATFTFGSRTGREVKSIRVITDDPDRPEHRLTMRVSIPVGLELQPRFLYWRADDRPDRRHIDVTVPGDEPIRVQGIEVDGDQFKAELETIEAGRRYRVAVTPRVSNERPATQADRRPAAPPR